jgi:general secretion pathway protein A
MDEQMSTREFYERGLVLKQVRMFYPAIEDFHTAASDPQYAGKGYMQMAMCLRAIGQDNEAVTAFRQAASAPMVSSVEQRHILYQLGQTLESLGRDAEGLAVYGHISKNDPEFLDVAQRIRHLRANKVGPFSWTRSWWKAWMTEGSSPCQAVSLPNPSQFWTRQGND